MAVDIDWSRIRRILVVRLRSIGDTVLATPSLIALKSHLPDAKVDILLEEWVAPVLDGFHAVDDVVIAGTTTMSRLATVAAIRRRQYDVVFNLHGGTTAALLTGFSGARFRIGSDAHPYSFLYTHSFSSPLDFWKRSPLHSAEQQLALVGQAGIPVKEKVLSRLAVTETSMRSLDHKVQETIGLSLDGLGAYALVHPAAAFATKEWPAENFARVCDHLETLGLTTIAIAAPRERATLDALTRAAEARIHCFDDLKIPEITALASKASLFLGNDSGIAHIAAAVQTPSVVIFGSSNRDHWRPWTDAPNEVVFESFTCQPCPGYECKEFGDPLCIKSVTVDSVIQAVERLQKKIERAASARSSLIEKVLPAV